MSDEKYQKKYEEGVEKYSEKDLDKVVKNEDKIKKKSKKGALKEYYEDIVMLFSMIKDYFTGDYREIPLGSIAGVVFTLLYILSPIDLIPDFIPVAGLIDDAAVLAICLKSIHTDFQRYKKFKENKEELDKKSIKGV